jgi:hypothetical protein
VKNGKIRIPLSKNKKVKKVQVSEEKQNELTK